VPKKVMAGALRSALSLRQKEQKLVVVDSFALDAVKTKRVDQALDKLGTSTALIVDGKNEKLARSTRNLQRAKYLAADGLNVYDVLDYETLILTRESVGAVTRRLAGAGGGEA
jgi:large subunit ribosomal protein L4